MERVPGLSDKGIGFPVSAAYRLLETPILGKATLVDLMDFHFLLNYQ